MIFTMGANILSPGVINIPCSMPSGFSHLPWEWIEHMTCSQRKAVRCRDKTPGIVYPSMDFSDVIKVLNGWLSWSKGGLFHHPHLIYSAFKDGFCISLNPNARKQKQPPSVAPRYSPHYVLESFRQELSPEPYAPERGSVGGDHRLSHDNDWDP